jgi:hypothetical protein
VQKSIAVYKTIQGIKKSEFILSLSNAFADNDFDYDETEEY